MLHGQQVMMKTPKHNLTHIRPSDDREAARKPLQFALLRRLWDLLRPYAAKRNVLLVLVVMRSIEMTLMVAFIPMILKGPVARGDLRGVIHGAIAMLGLAVITQVTLYFRSLIAQQIGEAVIYDLRNAVFARLQKFSMDYFDRTRLGRIISRMTTDVEAMRTGIQEVFFVSLVAFGQMFLAAAYMLWFDAVLFLLVLALAPVLHLINTRFRHTLSNVSRDVQESYSRVTATLAESVNGIRVTQGFVRQKVNAEAFEELVSDHAQYNMAVTRSHATFSPLLDLNSQLFIVGLVIIGGWRVIHGYAAVEDIVGFFLMLNQFFTPITNLGRVYTQAMSAMAGAERVFRLLDQQPTIIEPANAIDLPPMRGHIRFSDVCFSYQPDKPVLKGIDFVAEPGQAIALVGETGSGKTSIVNLLAKFYLPTSGRLTIDGHDIHQVKADSLRRQIGIVLQENFLFSGTVMDNIRQGRPDASDEDVIEATAQIGCADLFEQLPEGFQTPVGERGSNLSLGQRQLVCIARAMLTNPRLVLLDEATSSVDTMTEHRIQKALEVLLKGRTSFVVAHRLSTIRNSSLVLVMDEGRIVERGTHDQLLALGGVYNRLHDQFIKSTEA
ncbi:MAG: ABC transporter ATP-binding protein [Verrucomicrobia bacterium]|nr:ABC transporter ATP-binding protein [Verrucomicrobiota bacterium]